MTDLQTSTTGLGSSDQAAGLRQLFGEGFARVWCLVSSLPGDPTVMVALGAANALHRKRRATEQITVGERYLINK